MPKFTLQPNEERRVSTGGLFLSIVEASAMFNLTAPELGAVLIGESGRHFKLPGIAQVWFVNESASPIDIVYESSNVEVSSSGKGVVTVVNEIVVKRIVEAIQVNANATVENGKMSNLAATNVLAINDLTIPAGGVLKFADARAMPGRKVIIQTVTDDVDLSMIRIGSSAALTANQGIFLQGNLDAVAGYEFDTETAVYIRNVGDKEAVIAGGEQWR